MAIIVGVVIFLLGYSEVSNKFLNELGIIELLVL